MLAGALRHALGPARSRGEAHVRLDESAWRARLFAFDNCDPPDHEPAVFLQPSTNEAGQTVYTEKTAPPEVFLPPEGWCWL